MWASYTDVRILHFWFSRFLVLCLNSTVAEQKTTFFGWSRSWIFLYARLLFRHTSSCCSYSLKKKNIWHNWAHYYLFLIFHLNRMKIVIVIITAGVGSGITAGSGWELYTIQLVPAQGLQPESAEGSEPEPHKKRLGSPQHYTDRSIAMRQPHFCWRFCTLAVAILEKLVLLYYKVALQTSKDTFWRTKKKVASWYTYTRKPVVHTVANAGLLRLKYTATSIFW